MTMPLSPTVLVADDEEHVRGFVARVLRHNGYLVVQARHGLEALEKLREQAFDLLITDLNMPEMDGLTLLEECSQAFPETDMLMLTAYGTIESAVHAMKLGALDFMTKPFGIAELETKVAHCMELRHARRENAEQTTVKALVALNQIVASQSGLDDTLAAILDLVEQVLTPTQVCLDMYASLKHLTSPRVLRRGAQPAACASLAPSREQVERIAARPDAWQFSPEADATGTDAPWSGRTLTVPLVADTAPIGSLTLQRVASLPSYTRQDAQLLLLLAGQIALSTLAAAQRERMLSALHDLDDQRRGAVGTLHEALGAFDAYTREHSRRVACYARLLGGQVGLDEQSLDQLYVGALLHDIGKIGLENQYVRKHGSLTRDELDRVKLHPLMGAKIVARAPGLELARTIILTHHERLDGHGYPNQLSGDEIPFEGRLVAVVDTYDSMTSDRPYRAALTQTTAIKQLESAAGVQLDADLVARWIALMRAGEHERCHEAES